MLKAEFFRDERVGALSPQARLLFQSLWIHADDTGNGRADARLLKAGCFPFDDFTPEHVEAWLQEIVAQGMATLYDFEGIRYYSVNNFLRHQSVNRPSAFRFPTPPDPTSSSVSTHGALTDERERRKKKEKEEERKGESECSSPTGEEPAASSADSFLPCKEKIFELYGKRWQAKPTFRKPEEAHLARLLKEYSEAAILGAYSSYLQDEDVWVEEQRHPFSYFAKNMGKYVQPESAQPEFEEEVVEWEGHGVRLTRKEITRLERESQEERKRKAERERQKPWEPPLLDEAEKLQ
jgi:hypothetical protein